MDLGIELRLVAKDEEVPINNVQKKNLKSGKMSKKMFDSNFRTNQS